MRALLVGLVVLLAAGCVALGIALGVELEARAGDRAMIGALRRTIDQRAKARQPEASSPSEDPPAPASTEPDAERVQAVEPAPPKLLDCDAEPLIDVDAPNALAVAKVHLRVAQEQCALWERQSAINRAEADVTRRDQQAAAAAIDAKVQEAIHLGQSPQAEEKWREIKRMREELASQPDPDPFQGAPLQRARWAARRDQLVKLVVDLERAAGDSR